MDRTIANGEHSTTPTLPGWRVLYMALLLLVLGSPAYSESETPVVLEKLRVTGTHIQRTELEGMLPVFSLDRAAIDDNALLDMEVGLALQQPELVREARRAGVEVAAWTVDEEDRAAEALELGITRITTNQVERLLAWRFGLT